MAFFFRSRVVAWGLVVVLVLGAGGVIGSAFSLDRPIRQSIVDSQGKKWGKSPEGKFWAGVSKYGDWPQLMLFGVVLLGGALRFRKKDFAKVVVAAMLASTVAGVLANASRLTTGRVRPREEAKHGAGFYGPWKEGKLTVGNPAINSFPSGHTATAVGFAAPFVFAFPVVGIPFLAGAFGVAYSRMLLGAHHFSDVVTASVLALVVGWLILRWVQLRGDAIFFAGAEFVRRRFWKSGGGETRAG